MTINTTSCPLSWVANNSNSSAYNEGKNFSMVSDEAHPFATTKAHPLAVDLQLDLPLSLPADMGHSLAADTAYSLVAYTAHFFAETAPEPMVADLLATPTMMGSSNLVSLLPAPLWWAATTSSPLLPERPPPPPWLSPLGQHLVQLPLLRPL